MKEYLHPLVRIFPYDFKDILTTESGGLRRIGGDDGEFGPGDRGQDDFFA